MNRSRLALAALAGAVFANLVGYSGYMLRNSQRITFLDWLTNPNLSGAEKAAVFAILGAIIAVCLMYIFGQRSG